MSASRYRVSESGFTLVELMVALVLGLIVIGAVLTFTISSIRTNSGYVRSTRLQNELRNTMSYVVSELKRAGYDDEAYKRVGNPTFASASPFSPVSVTATSDCILYRYDRTAAPATATTPSTNVSLASGELRGIRRKQSLDGRGVVEFAQSTAAVTPTCGGGLADYTTYPASCGSDGWCPLTDPRLFDVTQLRFTFTESPEIKAPPLGMRVRNLRIWVQGRLTGGDSDLVRAIDTTLKVRADCVRPTDSTGQCSPVPPT